MGRHMKLRVVRSSGLAAELELHSSGLAAERELRSFGQVVELELHSLFVVVEHSCCELVGRSWFLAERRSLMHLGTVRHTGLKELGSCFQPVVANTSFSVAQLRPQPLRKLRQSRAVKKIHKISQTLFAQSFRKVFFFFSQIIKPRNRDFFTSDVRNSFKNCETVTSFYKRDFTLASVCGISNFPIFVCVTPKARYVNVTTSESGSRSNFTCPKNSDPFSSRDLFLLWQRRRLSVPSSSLLGKF